MTQKHSINMESVPIVLGRGIGQLGYTDTDTGAVNVVPCEYNNMAIYEACRLGKGETIQAWTNRYQQQPYLVSCSLQT